MDVVTLLCGCPPHGATRKERQLILNKAAISPPRPLEAYWLFVGSEAGQTQVLTVDPGGPGEALAVFGFEEEAVLFSLGALGAGWRLRETTAGDLIRILLGPCADVGFVALDPLPEMVSWGMVGLESLSRERFVDHLIESLEPLVSRAGEGTLIQEASGPEERPARRPRTSREATPLTSRTPASRSCRPDGSFSIALGAPAKAGSPGASEENRCRYSGGSEEPRRGRVSRSSLGFGAEPRRRQSDAQSS